MRSGFPVRSTSTARTLRSSQGCASPPSARCATHTARRGTLPFPVALPLPTRQACSVLCPVPVPPHRRRPTALSPSRPPKRAGEKRRDPGAADPHPEAHGSGWPGGPRGPGGPRMSLPSSRCAPAVRPSSRRRVRQLGRPQPQPRPQRAWAQALAGCTVAVAATTSTFLGPPGPTKHMHCTVRCVRRGR